ncbi:hypothetical protein Efla_005506 [Eimeria flavescens]
MSKSASSNAACELNEDISPFDGKEEAYPRDLEAFQQALLNLDSKFMQIAKDTNAEILRCLGHMWRQRRLQQLQDEQQQQQQQHASVANSPGPLFGAADDAAVGRKSGSMFRARAYRTAFEILQRARVPIHNVAEVLLLLREGGLVLRGEEAHLLRRGVFRSAVLQKIHLTISHGFGQLLRTSRGLLRESALEDLSRLPGVSKKTAALLFDELCVDTPQALRERLTSLPFATSSSRSSKREEESRGAQQQADAASAAAADATLSSLFPSRLSRACILHADAFGASMGAPEFDEWQQQLLLLQAALRDEEGLAPLLAEDEHHADRKTSCCYTAAFRAVPVLSLGGGIFRSSAEKVKPLSVLVSLLPAWTEEEQDSDLPAALERAVCSGGSSAGEEESRWMQQQWQRLTEAFKAAKQQLHRSTLNGLIRQGLIEEVLEENRQRGQAHAAGRLPWRRETLRLLSISAVPPREFPFASLAARCSASSFRLLQQRTRQQWGCCLSAKGISAARGAGRKAGGEAAGGPAAAAAAGHPAAAAPKETLDAKVLWVFDAEGVLRVLGEQLPISERVGTAML